MKNKSKFKIGDFVKIPRKSEYSHGIVVRFIQRGSFERGEVEDEEFAVFVQVMRTNGKLNLNYNNELELVARA